MSRADEGRDETGDDSEREREERGEKRAGGGSHGPLDKFECHALSGPNVYVSIIPQIITNMRTIWRHDPNAVV